MMKSNTDWNTMSLDDLWSRLIDGRALHALIEAAAVEDCGARGDITSTLAIDEGVEAKAQLRARRSGRLSGMRLVNLVAKRYDARLSVSMCAVDGEEVGPGQPVATITGPLRSMLAAERVMLNFLCHLSGIASLTDRYVQAVHGTSAKIYDTRKTIPGYRALAKYAVRCGGGMCHRMGLHDALLIKDNHLAHLDAHSLRQKIEKVVSDARRLDPPPSFIEVEVDSLKQFEQVIRTNVDVILLDNMSPKLMQQAVAMRDQLALHIQLEASGGVSLDTVHAMALSGVDRIAIGALTHSAPALDLGLDIDS